MINNPEEATPMDGPPEKEKGEVIISKSWNFDWDIWLVNLFKKKRNSDNNV